MVRQFRDYLRADKKLEFRDAEFDSSADYVAGEIERDPRATVPVRYRAADDFGLSRLELVARSAAGERRWPLELRAGSRSA